MKDVITIATRSITYDTRRNGNDARILLMNDQEVNKSLKNKIIKECRKAKETRRNVQWKELEELDRENRIDIVCKNMKQLSR